MNYYPFHLGDYAAHTAHLEPLEDLAYRRMLDAYYLREAPLPADPAEVARLIRMRQNMTEVEAVLREFFLLADDGWRHARCDDEIEHMQDKQAKARASAVASVNARRAKAVPTQSEGIANAQRTLNVRSTDAELPTPTPTPTPGISAGADSAPAKAVVYRAADLVKMGVPEQVATAYLHVRKTKRGGALTELALAGIKREAAKAELSLTQALTKCVERNWVGFEAEWLARSGPVQPATLADHNRAVMAEALRRADERRTTGGHDA